METNQGIYRVTELLNEKFRAVGFRTVTWGDPNEIDLNKQNIYPLQHNTLLSVEMTENSMSISVAITWVDIVSEGKNLDSRDVENQMSSVTNTEDIFHDLLHRINKGWLSFYQDVTIIGQLNESITMTAFYSRAQNKLAGYEAEFTIILPGGYAC